MTQSGNPEEFDDESGPLAEAWDIFGPSHVPYRVLLLGKMLERITTHHLRRISDLSLAEWRVMAHLAVLGKTSASGLSSAALVDRAEISRAVRMLEESALISRDPNPANRRSTLLDLTEKGRALYSEVHQGRQKFFATITSDLDDEDMRKTDEYLFRMARIADKMLTQGMDASEDLHAS